MSKEEHTRWNNSYRERSPDIREPSDYLEHHKTRIPRTGRALDIGGGDGRNAIWLANHGLDVTIVDISEVGLSLAQANASTAGVVLHTVAADLESTPLPTGPWNVIVNFYFLMQSLLPDILDSLAPGGVFLWVHPTQTNLLRHPRPGRRFLLKDGEALQSISDLDRADLEIVDCQQGWQQNGRHEARLTLRRSMKRPS